MRNRKILISGAGIAGPCLAWWLARYGFEPVLVERAPALRSGGYIIDFWGLGFEVAAKMGLLPALRRDAYDIDEVRIVDAQGKQTGGFKARVLEPLLGAGFVSLLRSDLAKLLYGSLRGEVRTLFGNSISAIEQDAETVRVSFTQAPPENFDLVIGADGLHSRVRTLSFGPEPAFETYLGYYTASFTAKDYPHRDPHAYVSYSAPGRQASRYSLRDNRSVFFFVFTAQSRLTTSWQTLDVQKEILRRTFGRDGWECAEMLATLADCDELYFDSVSQIQMPRWSNRRVALIGDACSCPSLLAGQGAALAMTQAYVLAGELRKSKGDYEVAFGSTEAMLRPLMERKQRAARGFAAGFAPRTRLGIFLRNRATRLMTKPLVVKLLMGGIARDRITLPDYDAL